MEQMPATRAILDHRARKSRVRPMRMRCLRFELRKRQATALPTRRTSSGRHGVPVGHPADAVRSEESSFFFCHGVCPPPERLARRFQSCLKKTVQKNRPVYNMDDDGCKVFSLHWRPAPPKLGAQWIASKTMKIGNLHLPNNLIMPLAGITDLAFRTIVRSYGCGLCYTEMVSADGLARGHREDVRLSSQRSRRPAPDCPDLRSDPTCWPRRPG